MAGAAGLSSDGPRPRGAGRPKGDPILEGRHTELSTPQRSVAHWTARHGSYATAMLALTVLVTGQFGLRAQSNTRLVLSSGAGVPGHAGFAFGPFSGLAMNESGEIVFLSTLSSARSEIRAVVRSNGVSFSLVAFQGLRSPVPKTAYDSFSEPSINNGGLIAFTATLKDSQEAPSSAVIRVEGTTAKAIVSAGDAVPGNPEARFQEFSAPLISARGDVVFAARWEGRKPGVGLFRWTPEGLRPLEVPAGVSVSPKDLLEPIFFSHDEAVFVSRQVPKAAALEQFFRAVATRSFQELKPAPNPAETVEVLPASPGGPGIPMLLVLMEGDSVQTALLPGEPAQAVLARKPTGGAEVRPLARIEGQTAGAQGNIIFAAAAAEPAADLGLYCYCDGQVIRLTSPEDFLPITQAAPGMPVLSLTGDSQQTLAFIAPGSGGVASAIYVTSIP